MDITPFKVKDKFRVAKAVVAVAKNVLLSIQVKYSYEMGFTLCSIPKPDEEDNLMDELDYPRQIRFNDNNKGYVTELRFPYGNVRWTKKEVKQLVEIINNIVDQL